MADQIVRLNNRFVASGEAVVSVFDRGFLYGDGLFETLRADHGNILYFDEHMERMIESAAELRIPFDKTAFTREILLELLKQNALEHEIARIRITLSRGVARGIGLPGGNEPTLLATVELYTPPNRTAYEKGIQLAVFRDGFCPSLAAMKTLSYLFYQVARQSASSGGAQEAVVLDRDGYVSETSTGSLLLLFDDRFAVPASNYQLPGITIGRFRQLMHDRGHSVADVHVRPEDLASARAAWVLNSLIGIVPIAAVDGMPLARIIPMSFGTLDQSADVLATALAEK